MEQDDFAAVLQPFIRRWAGECYAFHDTSNREVCYIPIWEQIRNYYFFVPWSIAPSTSQWLIACTIHRSLFQRLLHCLLVHRLYLPLLLPGLPSLVASGCRAAPSLVASGCRAALLLVASGCGAAAPSLVTSACRGALSHFFTEV